MGIKIALAGNPNCGKTTLFNALTGSNQYVGNWPGVTVEKKEGKMKGADDVIVTDLPGIYSLSPYTLEEVVARNYLVDQRPDAILNIVDGTNIERNLYLTTQLTELGIPVVLAINMMDIVRKNGDEINIERLSHRIGCPIVEISALKGTGILEAAEAAIEAAKKGAVVPRHNFSGAVEHALAHIEEAAVHNLPAHQQRWYAVKIFERDERVIKKLGLSEQVINHIEGDIKSAEFELDDDAESIITNERYNYVSDILKNAYKKHNEGKLTVSDKIDKIVTNRILGLPIFALIMFVVYYVSMAGLGGWMSDWVNEVLFGDIIPTLASNALVAVNCAPWLQSLIIDGVISGVGAVLGFVPQLFILFIFLAFLESCGYMSRVAFIMDKVFRKFGLSGKSFIPMLIGTGCSVPGIMASRTIENLRDRRMTIMTTSFIPCSAKLPVIGLIAGALFGGSGIVAVSAYFIGIGAVVISGLMLKKTRLFAGDVSPFVMELPAYHMPTADTVLRSMWERGWSFIKKAFTVIFISTIIIWMLRNFTFENGGFKMTGDINNSILADIGNSISWIFSPLGWGNWKAAVSSLTGLVAKENIVASFGQLYHFAGELSENGNEIWSALRQDFTGLSGYSFLIFNLLCAPCFAAVAAIRREMNSPKWTMFAIGYQCLFAYGISLMVYQFGMFFSGKGNILGLIFAVAVLAFLIYMLVRPEKSNTPADKKAEKETITTK